MELNYIISIVDRNKGENLISLFDKRELPIVLSTLARGTASRMLLDLYGLEATEKTVVMTIADSEKTKLLIRDLRKNFYIDMPGNGIILAIPVKSVGGGGILAFLSDNKIPDKSVPDMNFEYEMIVVILNENCTDHVMDAARKAGATGGTVLHAKGTGAKMTEHFYGVSLVNEKEIILIVAKAEEKAKIMREIIGFAGPSSKAGAIAFSLPISQVAGLYSPEED